MFVSAIPNQTTPKWPFNTHSGDVQTVKDIYMSFPSLLDYGFATGRENASSPASTACNNRYAPEKRIIILPRLILYPVLLATFQSQATLSLRGYFIKRLLVFRQLYNILPAIITNKPWMHALRFVALPSCDNFATQPLVFVRYHLFVYPPTVKQKT